MIPALTHVAAVVAAATPTPTPVPSVNPNDVTPGPIGFAAIALVALVAVFLIIDMVRRIRRVNYRAQIAEQLDAEQAAAAAEADGTAQRPLEGRPDRATLDPGRRPSDGNPPHGDVD